MGYLLPWYAVLFIGSVIGFGANYRLFRALGTRGFGFSKVTLLLLWGYVFWLGTSLKLTTNSIEGIYLALVLVSACVILLNKISGLKNLVAWLKQNWRSVLFSEAVFLAGFLIWAYIRSLGPEISGTEKPMELAFINAILNSNSFPPHDPWLSGYAISYYYFGYLITAMMCKITGLSGAVGFNLTLAMLFGLVAQGSFDLLSNLLLDKNKTDVQQQSQAKIEKVSLSTQIPALLGPLFILFVSNIEGLLEVLHSKGVFWSQVNGVWTSKFWSWLNIQELNQPPNLPFSLVPERVNGIWWWRASRVLQDFTQQGTPKEIIDEFPFFSYLLGDLHPHVYSMPFVLLVIAILYGYHKSCKCGAPEFFGFVKLIKQFLRGEQVGNRKQQIIESLRSPEILLLALSLGALSFMNAWDFPIYLVVTGLVLTDGSLNWRRFRIGSLLQLVEIIVVFALLGFVLYLPFYIGFDSQAGGFLPSLGFYTRGVTFIIMFAPFLLPIFVWLLFNTVKKGTWVSLKKGLLFSSIISFGLWIVTYLYAGLIFLLGRTSATFAQLGNYLTGLHESQSSWELLTNSLVDRIAQPGAWLILWIVLSFVFENLIRIDSRNPLADQIVGENTTKTSDHFVLILLLASFGLLLVPEFIYLRDQFGWRMNTIFKFYYQAWVMLAIAGAYTSIQVYKSTHRFSHRIIFAAVFSAVLLSGLLYPIFGLSMKVSQADRTKLSLDGDSIFERYQPEEYEAIQWLRDNTDGVIAEAVGGSYTGYARISTRTGIPTVIGWPGHESQWRGGAEEIGSRESDIELLYKTSNWEEAERIISQYDISYIYVGSLEQGLYRVNESKFTSHLTLAFENTSVRIYQVND